MIAVCKPAEIPGEVFYLAALCTGDFDQICERIGAKPKVNYVTHQKRRIDRYRWVPFRCSSGRFTRILKEDSNVHINVDLEQIGSDAYSTSDLDELIDFIGVEKSSVIRHLVPWVKWR